MMALPLLYAQPTNPTEWTAWSFNHAANHNDIAQAINLQKNQNLQIFVLDPIDPNNLGTWLYQHQIMHSQANQALGLTGQDLLAYDLSDPDQFAEFLRINATEHVLLSEKVGVG
jgi:hypothetical protein